MARCPVSSCGVAARRLRVVTLTLAPPLTATTQVAAAERMCVPPDPQQHMDVAELSGDNCGPHSSRPDRFFYPLPACPYSATPASLDDVGALAAAVRQNGFVVLRSLMPAAWVASCRAAFEPRLAEYLRRKGSAAPNRGPNRHYIDLPMRAPFVNMLANHTISE